MIKSILTSAIRNLFRNRSFSFINLAGLSISMSLSLLIIMVLKSQYSFDTFHNDIDKIYRINTEAIRVDGGTEPYASVPLAVATALRDEYSYTDDVVRLERQFRAEVTSENKNIMFRGLFADPEFFDVFNFPLIKGNGKDAISKPRTLVLTTQTAKKLFGEAEAMGQVITLGGFGEFTITGVIQPPQGPTHFEFEAIASMETFFAFEKEDLVRMKSDDFRNYYTGYSYIKLKNGVQAEDVERALGEIFKKHYADVQYETRDKGYRFYLQPLDAITPGPILSNNMGKGMPELLLVFMSVLAGIVMVMACFNYTQLMIAKSLTRAKEIGVRKIVGAKRWQVFNQFVGEAVVFSLAALIISYLLLQFIKPAFLGLHISQEFTVDLTEDYLVYGLFFGFAVMVGAIAGLLPAAYLSAFKPLRVLRGAGDLKVYSRLTFRKVLMVAQFTLSLIFILLVLTIRQQINYVVEADYGFNEDNLVNVRLQQQDFEKFATEVRRLAGVERVGGVSHSLGTWADGASDYKRNMEDDLFVMRDFSVDENYLKNLEVPLLAGKHFEPGVPRQIILNETALAEFGFEHPIDAVGEKIFIGDSTDLSIVGVVKDFHFRPLSYQVGPVAFRYDLPGVGIMSIRIAKNNMDLTMGQVEAIWKKLDTHPFDWRTMESEIDGAYEDAGFFDVLGIVGYITVVAITLACLGMLGMAMYATQTRVKEVGVRKVMGASVKDILFLLSKSFAYLILVAVIIGVPVSYYLGNQFLSMYAYRIAITPLLIGSGVLFLVGLGFITIGSQTLRAAVMNPVNSLRYE